MAPKLSDKAVAVFAFAAYHEMSSGETVVDVVLKDGAGHGKDYVPTLTDLVATANGTSLTSP